jgi:hypothetical protein
MSKVYLNNPNELPRIDEVFVFVSSDKDGEGIIGQTVVIDNILTFMPFVCADKKRMENIKPLAKMIGEESGKKIKLIRLSVREEIEEY